MRTDAFVLAVIGDFGGRHPQQRAIAVDRDRFDAVLDRMGVTIEVTVPAPQGGMQPVVLAPKCLDDLGPDAIVRAVPSLARLLAARRKAPDPALLALAPAAAAPVPPRDPRALLDVILGGTGEVPPAPARAAITPALEAFVREITAPALDRTDRAAQARWQAAVDGLLGAAVRAILHHPRFQALEAAWRGLHRLVSAVETDPGLEIRILDAPRAQATAAIEALREEAETPGGVPYAGVVAAYAFGAEDEDLAILDGLARSAARMDVPCIAEARPALLGLDDVRALGTPEGRARVGVGAEAWRRFRRSAAAAHLALCLPRVLLRPPYGPAGEPVEAFAFDEALTGRDHERFCWGSPALALGGVLARAFAEQGWDADLAAAARLEGLAAYVWSEDGEEHTLPCAEVVMSDATIERVVAEGMVAIASVRDQDAAHCYGLRTASGAPLRLRPLP